MGAIDSMRSFALANRALEDMQLKTIDNVRQVNAAVGSSVSGAVDNLQALFDTRVDASQATLAKLRGTIGGSIMDSIVKTAFMMIPEGMNVAAAVSALIMTGGSLVQMGYLISGAAEDYKNYASALGRSDDPGASQSGASKLVDLRDGLMPRYEYFRGPNGEHTNTDGYQGSLGTWRPI